MSVLELPETARAGRDTAGTAAVSPVACTPAAAPHGPHRAYRGFLARLVAAAGLTALAYSWLYADVLAAALAGSRTAFLVVVPVLLMLIAASYRTPPRGVGDAESDWIIAALIGAAGFAAIHLVGERMPSLSALWRLPMLGLAVWFACLLIIMFGVRHVLRMWPMWLFAMSTLTPLPHLLVTAALGGSDSAAVVVAAAFGAVAVALTVRTPHAGRRTAAAMSAFLGGVATAFTVGPHAGLLVTTALAAGAVPVAVTVAAHLLGVVEPGATRGFQFDLPQRSARSMALLLAVAAALLCLNAGAGTAAAHPDSVAADWIERSELRPALRFPFIGRYLGDGSRLDRYTVVPEPGRPAAAVDVITTANPALLRDFADTVWYPSAHPVSYRSAAPSDRLPAGTRFAHSDADAATTGTEPQWYALTWLWSLGTVHQQVTVIVSQDVGGQRPPPQPRPLSWPAASLGPALWLARQQPDTAGRVDEQVLARGLDLAAALRGVATDDPAPADV